MRKTVFVVIGEKDDPSWEVVGVTESLEDAQLMALEYYDQEEAAIDTGNPYQINAGSNIATIYERVMMEPSNGF